MLGVVRPGRRQITLNSGLRGASALDCAPLLVHELQHVADWLTFGRELTTLRGCLATEARAFQTQAATWVELNGGRLKPPANQLQREHNAIAQAIERDSAAFANRLHAAYEEECSPG